MPSFDLMLCQADVNLSQGLYIYIYIYIYCDVFKNGANIIRLGLVNWLVTSQDDGVRVRVRCVVYFHLLCFDLAPLQ